ncbi:TIGR00269 family protein [archaeon]|nr:TIGR00269 family protein [archaeon]
MCNFCKTKPVITLPNSNKQLCKSCFIKYFDKKVFKTIKKYELIKREDKILVAISGGKDSNTILHLLNKYNQRFKIKLEALAIDEGIKGYRNKTLKDAKKICKENKVKLTIISFKDEFGYTLDQLIKKIKLKQCTICGVLRRYLLNKYSLKLKANKLVTGHNLDDEVQSILMNQFRNNVEVSARLGPLTGIVEEKKFVRRIKPLYLLTEKEVATYAFLNKLPNTFTECPNAIDAYRGDVRDFINNFEEKYPGTKHSIINSFLKTLPLLKNGFKTSKAIKHCKKCKMPSSKEICQSCELLNKINL